MHGSKALKIEAVEGGQLPGINPGNQEHLEYHASVVPWKI